MTYDQWTALNPDQQVSIWSLESQFAEAAWEGAIAHALSLVESLPTHEKTVEGAVAFLVSELQECKSYE